jgi:branched-chain amino acid transport system permease protein
MEPVILGIALVNGILIGGLYGAVALSLSLIFGVMRVINFAHGSLLMVGMFVSYWLWRLLGLNPYVSIVFTAPILFGLGYFIQATVISPLFKRERAMVLEPLSVLLLTAGVFMILDNSALLLFGPDFRAVQMDFSIKTIRIGILAINWARLIAFLAGIGVTIALSLFLSIIGSLMVPFYPVSPSLGIAFGIKSFIVVVLGGIGSLPGCILGGLLLGIVESVTAQFVTSTSAAIFSFVIFILVLTFKPTGLMGQRV